MDRTLPILVACGMLAGLLFVGSMVGVLVFANWAEPNREVGAFAAVTGWIPIEHILSGLEQYFSGDMLKRNIRCAERGFHEVEVIQW